MVGVLLPWAHGLQSTSHGFGRSSTYGISSYQGLMALAGAWGFCLVCALRVDARIGDIRYLVLGTAMCLLSLGASIWFWNSEVGRVDPITASLLFSGTFRISSGEGLRLTFVSLATAQLCLIAFAVDAPTRLARLRIVHDNRKFAGGSLLPDRIRFRIVSRVRMPR